MPSQSSSPLKSCLSTKTRGPNRAPGRAHVSGIHRREHSMPCVFCLLFRRLDTECGDVGRPLAEIYRGDTLVFVFSSSFQFGVLPLTLPAPSVRVSLITHYQPTVCPRKRTTAGSARSAGRGLATPPNLSLPHFPQSLLFPASKTRTDAI